MSYDKNQKLNYIGEVIADQKGLLDFIDNWPGKRSEYDRAGLSGDLTDDDLAGSVYSDTAVTDLKATITACDELHATLLADPDITAYRGQIETLARRR